LRLILLWIGFTIVDRASSSRPSRASSSGASIGVRMITVGSPR